MRTAFVLLAALALITPSATLAQVRAMETEISVNAGEDFKPRSPVAVFGADGSSRVIWENDQLGILSRPFDREGRATGPAEVLIANDRLPSIPGVGPVVYRSEPTVAPLPGGGFFLFWTEEASVLHVQVFHEWRDIQSRHIMAQRFNPQGKALGQPFQVSSGETFWHGRAQAALNPLGGVLVVWETDDRAPQAARYGIFGRHYQFGGPPTGPAFRIDAGAGDPARRPALAVNAEGLFLVAWEACCDAGGNRDVVARFLEGGSPAGEPFQVNTVTAGNQRRPAVGSDPWSHFLVTWQGHVEHEDYPFASRIFGQLLSRSGAFMGGEIQLSDSPGTSQVGPAMSGTPSGGYLVTWQDFEKNFPVGIWAVEVDSFGELAHSEMLLSTSQVNARIHIGVATDGKGEFMVTWEGFPGDELGVVGKRLAREKARRFSQGLSLAD